MGPSSLKSITKPRESRPLGAHGDLDAPVVAVEALTLAGREPQLVRGGDEVSVLISHMRPASSTPRPRLDYGRTWCRGRSDAASTEPEPIDAILARAGEDRFAPTQPPISLVAWRAAVGPRIADQTVPLIARARASSSCGRARAPGRRSSRCSRRRILARLRAARASPSTRLRFRTGPRRAPAEPLERRATRTVPAPVELPSSLATRARGRRRRRAARAILATPRREPRWPLRHEVQRIPASRSRPSRRWNRKRSAGPS